MKKIILFLILLVLPSVLANSLPVCFKPLDSNGLVTPLTNYNYTLNFTTASDCSNVVLSVKLNITMSSDGTNCTNISLDGIIGFPIYVCEYRNGVLRKVHEVSSQTFNKVYTQEINVSGNISADWGFFNYLMIMNDLYPFTTLTSSIGSGASRWLWLYVQNISAENIDTYSLHASENISTDSYFIGSGAYLTNLNVTGDITGYSLNISFLYGHGGLGGIDLTGDPWYLGGVDFEVDQNLQANNITVENNININNIATITNVNATNVSIWDSEIMYNSTGDIISRKYYNGSNVIEEFY